MTSSSGWSLRARLTSVIAVVALVMGLVSAATLRSSGAIRDRVAQLGRASDEPLGRRSLVDATLSIEGDWNGEAFVAARLELLPWSRRPKLRAAVDGWNPDASVLRVLGRDVRIDADTSFDDEEAARSIAVGERVELSCKLDDGNVWVARKVKSDGVKASDKVKGNVTEESVGANGGRVLSIEGLRVEVPRDATLVVPGGALYRSEVARDMALAVRDCEALARELLVEGQRLETKRSVGPEAGPVDPDSSSDTERDAAFDAIEKRLRDEVTAFVNHVGASVASDRAYADASFEQRLAPLVELASELEVQVDAFVALARSAPARAAEVLAHELAPLLRDDVARRVEGYHDEVEDELVEDLRAVGRDADAAVRTALALTIAGLAAALLLGYLASRSIREPVETLVRAADEFGAGRLGARVRAPLGAELGRVAEAFNAMADGIAANTVSVKNLNNVIDSMAGALFLLDEHGRITSVNPAALALLERDEDELVSRPFDEVFLGDVAGHGSEFALLRKDGHPIPVSYSRAVLRNEDGAARGAVCVAQDITRRKELEARLRMSLGEKELLLREVHHRVKNNLQVISSLLDLQMREVDDPNSLDKFQESQDRIRSMVYIHDQLYRSDDLTEIDLGAYLQHVAQNLSQAYLRDGARVSVEVEVEPMRLDLDRALTTGMVVNELVTNAIKHAFPGDAAGRVRVSCKRAGFDALGDGERLVLEVADDGVGLPPHQRAAATSSRTPGSLGLSLVGTFVAQLGGELEIESGRGTAFRITFAAQRERELV